MRKLLVAAAVAGIALVAGACAPPGPGPATTTTTGDGGLPVAPRLATEPIGAEDHAAIVAVRGLDYSTRLYAATDTWHRQLDWNDLEDRAALAEAANQIDASGRLVRSAGIDFENHWLEMCDSVAADDCTKIPGTDMFNSAVFSPDGTMLYGLHQPLGAPPTLRIFDAVTYETIVEATREAISVGIGADAWSPDSGAVVAVIDNELYTLAAVPGAEPQLVSATDESTAPLVRQAVAPIGWSSQGRILSVWIELDISTWPPVGQRAVIESVEPDGDGRRDVGDANGTGYGVLAPNGAIVWPVATGVTGYFGPGSVPVAHFDEPGSEPQALSLPWTENGPDGLLAAQVDVLGFVPRAAVGAP